MSEAPSTNEESSLSTETYREMVERTRIGNRTVRRAEEQNRKHGVPTVYLIRNRIYYERADGTLWDCENVHRMLHRLHRSKAIGDDPFRP